MLLPSSREPSTGPDPVSSPSRIHSNKHNSGHPNRACNINATLFLLVVEPLEDSTLLGLVSHHRQSPVSLQNASLTVFIMQSKLGLLILSDTTGQLRLEPDILPDSALVQPLSSSTRPESTMKALGLALLWKTIFKSRMNHGGVMNRHIRIQG